VRKEPAGSPMNIPAPTPPATRQLLLSVWCPRVGEFSARVVLADGSLREFDSPFELVRFLAAPPVPPAGGDGLR
jgi:hypothetical protein